MNIENQQHNFTCPVCGASGSSSASDAALMNCNFCGFKKRIIGGDKSNADLLTAHDINIFFKNLYNSMDRGDTGNLSVPVTRIYSTPPARDGQINFFRSKNIMFLLEQHGFHMVSRKSRFSTELNLIIRKV